MKKITFPFILTVIMLIISSCGSVDSVCMHPYSQVPPLNSFMELEYMFETHWAELPGGEKIAFVDEGEGETTLILIHGLGSYIPAWNKNIPELSKHFRVIAIDLPGYGKSGKIPHSGKMTYYASVVNDFAQTLGLGKVVLGGHSMGGQISMVTALYYPERVDKLILSAPAGFETFTEGQKQWFRDVMTVRGVKLTTVEDIISNLAYNFYNLPDDAEFMITDRIAMRSATDFDAYAYAVVQSVTGMVDESVLNHLHKIEQPVLIMFGEYDNLIPNRFLNPGRTVDVARSGAEKLPNHQLFMVPNSGHFVQFESYQFFNEKTIEFLGQ